MGPVHVRVGHDNNLVVPKLGNIKILVDSRSKGGDHGFDLRIAVDSVKPCLLHVENLSSQGENSLGSPASGRLGRAAGGISLYDVNLTFSRILIRTVRQLTRQGHAV